MRKTLIQLALITVLASANAAQALSIDGNLSDWGVQQNSLASGWQPYAGLDIRFTIEDQTGNANTYLNPGWGGQAYDAEAIYALIQDQTLFIALATGHNPNTLHNPGANSYGAGDFAIDFGKNGSYELGINIKHVLPNGQQDFGVSGGVYKNPTWALGLFNEVDPDYPLSTAKHPAYLTGGDWIGDAALDYTTDGATGYGTWANDRHYFYELSLGLNLLTEAGWKGESFNIHWTMNCGNDSIFVDPPVVPEPATLALLPLGMLGLLVLRRRGSAG